MLDFNVVRVIEMAVVQSRTLKHAKLQSDHHYHLNTNIQIVNRPYTPPVA